MYFHFVIVLLNNQLSNHFLIKSPVSELSFYNSFLGEWNITKYSKDFKNHMHSYIEMLHSQIPPKQFNIVKPYFKNC